MKTRKILRALVHQLIHWKHMVLFQGVNDINKIECTTCNKIFYIANSPQK